MTNEQTGGLAAHLAPERAAAFLGLIRAGERLESGLDRSLEQQHGLGLRGFEILLFLSSVGAGGTLRMSDLNRWAPLSQSRVSRLVGDLEAKGWVERHPAPEDGRGVAVTITAAGRRKFEEARTTHLRDLDRLLFGRLTDTEIRQLGSLTGKLLDAD